MQNLRSQKDIKKAGEYILSKLKSLVAIFIFNALIFLSGCSIFYDGGAKGADTLPENITIHYYGDVSKTYKIEEDTTYVEGAFIAEPGKRIVGLYDENGIQYADYTCKIDLSDGNVPENLYAKYKDVDISYIDDDPFMVLDEDPKQISFYTGTTYYWDLEYPEDEEIISACLCNPYADITFVVSFVGKGNRGTYGNTFRSKLKLGDDAIASFAKQDLGKDYTSYTFSGKVKAKQLTNVGNVFKLLIDARYGTEDYTVKNFRIDISFDFEESEKG